MFDRTAVLALALLGALAPTPAAQDPADDGDPALAVTDRQLDGGGRVVALRAADEARAVARLGFAARNAGGPELALRHARALDRALRVAIGERLAAADARLVVERTEGALVLELETPAANLEGPLQLLMDALADVGSRLAGGAEERRSPAFLGAASIDLAGRLTSLGPERWTPAARAIAVLLESQPRIDANPGRTLAEYHAGLGQRASLVVGIAANLDPEGAVRLATELAAVLPVGEAPPAPPAEPLAIPLAREVEAASGETADEGGLAVLAAGCRADAPDAPALLVLEEVLRTRLAVLGPAPEALGLAPGTPAAGASLLPGWGRPGRIALWLEAPAAELAARAVEFLEEIEDGSSPPEELALDAARRAALRRVADGDDPVDLLRREHRLAVHGAPPGWRAQVAREVEALDGGGLVAAAQRHLAAGRLRLGASTTPEGIESLARLGDVVPRPAPSADEAPAGAAPGGPRTGADPAASGAAAAAVESLLEAVGGRALWLDCRAVRLTLDSSVGGLRVTSTQELDLRAPRLRVRVEGGGTTVLDVDRAHWSGPGGRRELDPEPLVAATREGLFHLLHLFAQQDGSLEVEALDDVVHLRSGAMLDLRLVRNEDGRPAALHRGEATEAAWTFVDWREEGGRWIPGTIEDVARGVTFTLQSFEALERFDPTWLR